MSNNNKPGATGADTSKPNDSPKTPEQITADVVGATAKICEAVQTLKPEHQRRAIRAALAALGLDAQKTNQPNNQQQQRPRN